MITPQVHNSTGSNIGRTWQQGTAAGGAATAAAVATTAQPAAGITLAVEKNSRDICTSPSTFSFLNSSLLRQLFAGWSTKNSLIFIPVAASQCLVGMGLS